MTTLYGPEFFVGRRQTVIDSAAVVVPVVVDALQPASVLDVGCGMGEWMDAFAEHAAHVYGVDIAENDRDNYLRWDLTWPLDLGAGFDLAVCLEVGEHLPETAADTLVDTLTQHSDTVLFSAAVVGQEGVGHINCQPHDYWHAKFAERGYTMSDPFRPLLISDGRVSAWYRNNLFLYTASG